MHYLRNIPLLLFACSQTTQSVFLGPTYPAPYDLSSDRSLVAAAWKNFSSQLDGFLNDTLGGDSALGNITFSVNAFSIHDDAASEVLQYHHTGPQVRNSAVGAKEVNADSIYHVASVTKLFTVYAALLALQPADWERPLSEIFPELAAKNGSSGVVSTTQWDKVTPYELAAQMGDIPRDGIPLASSEAIFIYAQLAIANGLNPLDVGEIATERGLPPLDYTDPTIFPCASIFVEGVTSCASDEYLRGVAWRDATFLPFTQPAYSNNGLVLLGLVLQNLTGKTLPDLYDEYLFKPLGMTSSHILFPGNDTLDRCVIGADSYSVWTSLPGENGWAEASGNLMTTPNDMAKLGVSILNSTLLSQLETRKWLKPISHTSNLEYSVGMPWEIARYTNPATGQISDIYPKSGDSGSWLGYLGVIPDYDMGFSIAAAWTTEDSSTRTTTVSGVADLLIQNLMTALEAQAAAEAMQKFAGTYVSTVGGLNSSLTLALNTTEGAAPGLTVTRWISNGTDLLAEQLLGSGSIVLQPTIDTRQAETGPGQVAFRHNFYYAGRFPQQGLASQGLFVRQWSINADWFDVGAITYGGVGLDLFVFDLGEDGRAIAVSPAALRVRLERKDE